MPMDESHPRQFPIQSSWRLRVKGKIKIGYWLEQDLSTRRSGPKPDQERPPRGRSENRSCDLFASENSIAGSCHLAAYDPNFLGSRSTFTRRIGGGHAHTHLQGFSRIHRDGDFSHDFSSTLNTCRALLRILDHAITHIIVNGRMGKCTHRHPIRLVGRLLIGDADCIITCRDDLPYRWRARNQRSTGG